MKEVNLEEKFAYRAIKVLYILSFALVILISGVIGWDSKPQKYIDSSLSYIQCSNGNKYTFDAVGIYAYSKKQFTEYNDRDARFACAYAKKYDYSNNLPIPNQKNYTTSFIESVRGSWGAAIAWWFFGVLGGYILLNVAKETLLYLFLGKKFDWSWLASLIRNFTN